MAAVPLCLVFVPLVMGLALLSMEAVLLVMAAVQPFMVTSRPGVGRAGRASAAGWPRYHSTALSTRSRCGMRGTDGGHAGTRVPSRAVGAGVAWHVRVR
eukprot:1279465-Rhodomonas_salina.1